MLSKCAIDVQKGTMAVWWRWDLITMVKNEFFFFFFLNNLLWVEIGTC